MINNKVYQQLNKRNFEQNRFQSTGANSLNNSLKINASNILNSNHNQNSNQNQPHLMTQQPSLQSLGSDNFTQNNTQNTRSNPQYFRAQTLQQQQPQNSTSKYQQQNNKFGNLQNNNKISINLNQIKCQDCNTKVANLEQHQRFCPKRPVQCPKCSQMVPKREISFHVCSNQGNQTRMKTQNNPYSTPNQVQNTSIIDKNNTLSQSTLSNNQSIHIQNAAKNILENNSSCFFANENTPIHNNTNNTNNNYNYNFSQDRSSQRVSQQKFDFNDEQIYKTGSSLSNTYKNNNSNNNISENQSRFTDFNCSTLNSQQQQQRNSNTIISQFPDQQSVISKSELNFSSSNASSLYPSVRHEEEKEADISQKPKRFYNDNGEINQEVIQINPDQINLNNEIKPYNVQRKKQQILHNYDTVIPLDNNNIQENDKLNNDNNITVQQKEEILDGLDECQSQYSSEGEIDADDQDIYEQTPSFHKFSDDEDDEEDDQEEEEQKQEALSEESQHNNNNQIHENRTSVNNIRISIKDEELGEQISIEQNDIGGDNRNSTSTNNIIISLKDENQEQRIVISNQNLGSNGVGQMNNFSSININYCQPQNTNTHDFNYSISTTYRNQNQEENQLEEQQHMQEQELEQEQESHSGDNCSSYISRSQPYSEDYYGNSDHFDDCEDYQYENNSNSDFHQNNNSNNNISDEDSNYMLQYGEEQEGDQDIYGHDSSDIDQNSEQNHSEMLDTFSRQNFADNSEYNHNQDYSQYTHNEQEEDEDEEEEEDGEREEEQQLGQHGLYEFEDEQDSNSNSIIENSSQLYNHEPDNEDEEEIQYQDYEYQDYYYYDYPNMEQSMPQLRRFYSDNQQGNLTQEQFRQMMQSYQRFSQQQEQNSQMEQSNQSNYLQSMSEGMIQYIDQQQQQNNMGDSQIQNQGNNHVFSLSQLNQEQFSQFLQHPQFLHYIGYYDEDYEYQSDEEEQKVQGLNQEEIDKMKTTFFKAMHSMNESKDIGKGKQEEKEKEKEKGEKDNEKEQDKQTAKGGNSCAICICDFQNGEKLRQLKCNHRFHIECIDDWLKIKGSCPMCREDFTKQNNDNHNEQGNIEENHNNNEEDEDQSHINDEQLQEIENNSEELFSRIVQQVQQLEQDLNRYQINNMDHQLDYQEQQLEQQQQQDMNESDNSIQISDSDVRGYSQSFPGL